MSDALHLTAAAILKLRADYRAVAISLETFKRREAMLINSVHRSSLDVLQALLAAKGTVKP